jgi:hypothetical protein
MVAVWLQFSWILHELTFIVYNLLFLFNEFLMEIKIELEVLLVGYLFAVVCFGILFPNLFI